MSNDSLPLSSHACFYLQLSRGQRKIFQYLRWYMNRYPKSFPRVSNIAKFCGISIRAVQKFFASLDKKGIKHFYLTITPRFHDWGGNKTNEYVLNKNFKLAMDWLEIHHKLNSPKKRTREIILSMQKQEKVHPPSPKKFTPISKDYSFRKDQTTGLVVCINYLVKNLGIDAGSQIFATRYASDHEIVEAIEACKYQEKKKKLLNPSSYFIGVLKNKMKNKQLFV